MGSEMCIRDSNNSNTTSFEERGRAIDGERGIAIRTEEALASMNDRVLDLISLSLENKSILF